MSIKNAWLGLIDKLPVNRVVETVNVIGPSAGVVLYTHSYKTGEVVEALVPTMFGNYPTKVPTKGEKYFHTCADAHASAGGEPVREVHCVRVGGKYWPLHYAGLEVTPQPKPKVSRVRK